MLEKLRLVSTEYCHDHDRPVIPIDYAAVRSDERVGKRIAAAYLSAPVVDPQAIPAYRAIREETLRQLNYLMRVIHVEVTQDDPYKDASELMAELREGRMRVWSTAAGSNPHPYFTDDDNDAFRAVHDGFGHGGTGQGFDPHGEEATWHKHRRMYSALARQAMTTETRGQTCMFVYGNRGEFFSEQKAIILPEEFWA